MKSKSQQVITTIVPNAGALSPAINIKDFDSGAFIIPAAWTAASLAFKVCDTISGTYVPLRDKAGALIEMTSMPTAASEARLLPAEVFNSAPFVKLWSETAGADVTQGADRVFTLCLVARPN